MLFRSDLFLKIKQESSGWPADCLSEAEKEKYVREYYEKEGVRLEPASIAKNPGRCQVAKLALNSFWGRYVSFSIEVISVSVKKKECFYDHYFYFFFPVGE